MQRMCVLVGAMGMAVCGAQAAEVQVFGFLDQGLTYLHEDLNAGMGGPVGQSLS